MNPIKELTNLPGYYECPKCHNHYLSDFPFAEARCLECGSEIPATQITAYELDGLLYNLHIMASIGDTWKSEQIGEFCHYEDMHRLILLMRFLLGNGYVHFKEKEGSISELAVYAKKVAVKQRKGA